jgi:hypothetical protein
MGWRSPLTQLGPWGLGAPARLLAMSTHIQPLLALYLLRGEHRSRCEAEGLGCLGCLGWWSSIHCQGSARRIPKVTIPYEPCFDMFWPWHIAKYCRLEPVLIGLWIIENDEHLLHWYEMQDFAGVGVNVSPPVHVNSKFIWMSETFHMYEWSMLFQTKQTTRRFMFGVCL